MEVITEMNSKSYFFAYYCEEDDKWNVCKRQFILSKDTDNNICGSYISSNWYKQKSFTGKVKFAIIKKDKIISLCEIEQYLNQSVRDMENDNIEYYEVSREDLSNVSNDFNDIQLKHSNGNSISLSVSYKKDISNENGKSYYYFTLPNFTQAPHNQ